MQLQLLSLVGINRRLTESESTVVLILGALVVLTLFVAVEPETRIFLMFLDSVGVDLFVTLCVLFLRHNLVLVASKLVPDNLQDGRARFEDHSINRMSRLLQSVA